MNNAKFVREVSEDQANFLSNRLVFVLGSKNHD